MAKYQIKAGDTLGALATQNKTDLASILKLNPGITDANKIQAGAFLNLPDLPGATPTLPTSGVNTTDSLRKELKDGGASVKSATALPDQTAFDEYKSRILPKEEKPDIPNLVESYNKLRTDMGVVPLEEKITGYKDQKRVLTDKFKSFQTTAGGAETLGVMRGRISEEARAVQNELDSLTRLEELATDQLNLKNTTISNIIGLTKDDYNTTNARWNETFQQNLGLTNSFNQEVDRDKTEARATITTMQSMLKDSGITFDKIDPTMKAQIQSLELKAGLPAGLFETAYKVAPDKIQTVGSRTAADGTEYFDVLRLKPDGTPYVQSYARGGGGSSGPGNANVAQYGTVATTASTLPGIGADKGKTSKANIDRALANNDYPTAYATIANNVEDSLTGGAKEKFQNARTDYQVMSGLRTAIQKYADEGGNMNLLVGTAESIKRKLGIDSGKASETAVMLWREFQTYRNNMTGAAFSKGESKDYEAVNPSLNKTLNLNLSVIDGAMAQLENRITSTVETRVPGASKIYQQINPSSVTTQRPEDAKTGSIIDVGGVKYKVVGPGLFEPIE